MRKILFILALFLSVYALGQDTDQNYSKVITYRDTIPSQTRPLVEVAYYDGLGSPIQQIVHKQSGTGKDIITHIEYDAFGRQVKEFLPFANQAASLSYNQSALNDVQSFYNADAYENTQNPYSEKLFENSPLNKVMKQAAPGADWQLNTNGSDHSIKFDYSANLEDKDDVKNYKVSVDWRDEYRLYRPRLDNSDGMPFYGDNQLYKYVVKDENWISGKNNTTEEYKDKEGRIILKRTYNNDEAYDTYYAYDVYGNLAYVIPPAVDGRNITDEILNGLCYQYKYDSRNRLVEKKMPGKQWEFIVYDRLDRVVSTGPALFPWGAEEVGWLYTKYDDFNRVVYTGWHASFPVTSEGRVSLMEEYVPDIVSETRGEDILNDEVLISYTNWVYPKVAKLLTVTYYDDYNYHGAPEEIPTTVLDGTQAVYYNETVKPKGFQTGSWTRILTNPNEILGESSYTLYDKKNRAVRVYSSNDYYLGYTQTDSEIDFSGKTLQSETRHKRTSNDGELVVKDSYQYTEQDRLLLHKQQINSDPEQLIVQNTYDELGQLISKNVGGTDVTGATGLQKIDYKYNVRGWLKQINDIGDTSNFENDLFAFKINYNTVEDNLNSTIKELYNGNISETFWKTTSDNVLRKYGYKYDDLNRLLKATYQKPLSVLTVTNAYNEELTYDKNGNIKSLLRTGHLDSEIQSFGGLVIDDLSYDYNDDESPNQLVKVIDRSAVAEGFKDDSDGENDMEKDYAYDGNGNMIKDENKNIESIKYNHLNLPVKISFADSNIIDYIYTASGQKFLKKVTDLIGLSSGTTDYLNGFQYKNDALQFFPHAEGYVYYMAGTPGGIYGEPGTPESFNYVFNYTDHLGNIRLKFGLDPLYDEVKIIEEDHYYPFGLKHANYNTEILIFQEEEELGGITLRRPPVLAPKPPANKYKYNGFEFQDELGLNVYDYENRTYDPAIGRWWEMDPLAENGRRWSPYTYAMDNPVYFIDPDGMWPDNPFKGLVKAVKQTVASEYKSVKRAASNALTSIGKSIEKFEKGLGGFDFQSDLKSPSDRSDSQQKRNARDVEKVDATGFDVASGISGPKGKGNGKTDATKVVTSAVKDVKEGVEKFKDGMDTGKMVETVKDVAVSSMSKANTPETDTVTYVVEGYSTKNKEMRAASSMDPVGKKNAEEVRKTMSSMPEIDSVVVKRKY
jgi:RHS repeat-associated protein